MGFKDGKIVLDREDGVYYVGQTVFGKYQFSDTKQKSCRGIYVSIKGFADVEWASTRNLRSATPSLHRRVRHKGHEDYFHMKEYLLGSENGEITIAPGNHELPFQCHIPSSCPASFEGQLGHIRYEVKVVMDRVFKFDHEKKVRLKVISPIDLNLDPACKEPLQFEFTETYSCCLFGAGSCKTVVSAPARGFCPGHLLPIQVTCNNTSSVELHTILFVIDRRTRYRSDAPSETKEIKERVTEMKTGPVPERTTKTWTVNMEIPVFELNGLAGCRLIEIDYSFKVELKTSGLHMNTDDSKRVVLGNIPLRDIIIPFTKDPMSNVPITSQPIRPILTITEEKSTNPYPLEPQRIKLNPSPYPTPQPVRNIGFHTEDSPTGMPHTVASSYSPSNPPYPISNSPYPAGNSPYPAGNSPYPAGNSPYPAGNSPYPIGNSPYPTNTLHTAIVNGRPKSPMIGLLKENERHEAVPLMPFAPPYPNTPSTPRASAPVATPDSQLDGHSTPYNPQFMHQDTK